MSLLTLTASAPQPRVWNGKAEHENVIVEFEFHGIGTVKLILTEPQAQYLADSILQDLENRGRLREEANPKTPTEEVF